MPTRIRYLAAALVVLFAATACEVPDPQPDQLSNLTTLPTYTQTEVKYGTRSGQEATIYTPNNVTGPAPVIVYIHGGAWFYGDRSELHLFGAPILDQLRNGWVVVNIEYRRTPTTSTTATPVQLADVETALRWVRSQARSRGWDTKRTVLAGTSAGGHLALLAANRDVARNTTTRNGVRTTAPTAVRAVIALSAPVDLTETRKGMLSAAVHNLSGCSRVTTTCTNRWKALSPHYQNVRNHRPMYLAYAPDDNIIPLTEGRKFASKVIATNGDHTVWFDEVANGGHGATGVNTYAVAEFLNVFAGPA